MNKIPFPPVELRRIVGPTEESAFDNPDGSLIWGDLAYGSLKPGEAYQAVFDFGCGCGRNARQLMLQNPPPDKYLGIDISRPLIEWCQANLAPLNKNFQFLHHDVYSPNPCYVPPGSGQSNKRCDRFPSKDSQFTLFNAISVFTHLYYDQSEHYLKEAKRILKDNGLMRTSWFFINKKIFPVLQPFQHCIYVNETDPTQAVYYDWEQFLVLIRSLGLAVVDVRWTDIQGFQSEVCLGKSDFFKDISPELTPPKTVIGY
jgi:SAM-dependent methyltransferase